MHPSGRHSVVAHLLATLARLGVREFCVAAGARNAAIIAALEASRGIKIWSFFEERCAAFFALGRIMQDRAPVAVLTTSGTAVAELLPAMIEGYYQGLPLIAVTADRPAHFRGTGAPQAIEQPGLFGPYAAPTIDLAANDDGRFEAAPVSVDGPLHINICLEEGIDVALDGLDFDEFPNFSGNPFKTDGRSDPQNDILLEFLRHNPVILAAGLHPADADLLWAPLAELNAPIIAEATANLHGHPRVLEGGERRLAALEVSHIIRIGAVPSWRWWRDLEDRPEVHVLNLARFAGLARQQNVHTVQSFAPLLDIPSFEQRPPTELPHLPQNAPAPLSEAAWMEHLIKAIPAGSRVFLGNSLPIREFNEANSGLTRHTYCYANRGANGIDGLVSTFLGISATGPESWILLGDLSALYDLAAPWILGQLPPGNRRIVVVNNGGGMIFSKVASLRGLPETARAIIENRHTLSFAPWAELWKVPYRRATLPEHLQNLPHGPVLIEVIPGS